MSIAAVKQLLHGVKVVCADGFECVCKPLPVSVGMEVIDLWDVRADPATPPEERARARLKTIRLFAAQYPELTSHISAGDVEELMPDFFWGVTGVGRAATLETESTGTSSGSATAPPGESSPTP